jgi:membrane associated rhomboid family serine protease
LNPLALAQGQGLQLWRLWTCHALHYDLAHLLLNAGALGIPFLLNRRQALRMALGLLLLAPVLSLALLPALGGGEYRGASGLACAAWSMAGFVLCRRRETRLEGGLLLGFLVLKVFGEAAFGSSVAPHGQAWANLPAAHRWGMLLGALYAPLVAPFKGNVT